MIVKIFLYEDNSLLRESISSLFQLQDDHELLLAKAHTNEILDDLKGQKPDLILMDIEMPGQNGIDAISQIRKKGINLPVIILTVFEDNENVLRAIKAGASGYLLKKHISNKLFDAIREVLDGGAPMSPRIAKMVVSSMHKNHRNDYQLTERETAVLSELSKGNSFKMIAAQLEISIDTVRTHIKHIYDKLQVRSQTEAVKIGRAHV